MKTKNSTKKQPAPWLTEDPGGTVAVTFVVDRNMLAGALGDLYADAPAPVHEMSAQDLRAAVLERATEVGARQLRQDHKDLTGVDFASYDPSCREAVLEIYAAVDRAFPEVRPGSGAKVPLPDAVPVFTGVAQRPVEWVDTRPLVADENGHVWAWNRHEPETSLDCLLCCNGPADRPEEPCPEAWMLAEINEERARYFATHRVPMKETAR